MCGCRKIVRRREDGRERGWEEVLIIIIVIIIIIIIIHLMILNLYIVT